MRLLVITSSWPRFQGDFAGHFIRDWVSAVGYPATVIAPDDGCPRVPEPGVERVRYARSPRLFYGGGALANLRARPFTSASQLPSFLAAAARAAVRHARDADIIVSHWLVPCGLVGAFVARATGRPHVAIAHGSDVAVVSSVPVVGRRVVRRAVRIPMGIYEARAAPLRDVLTRAIFLGRFEREKGLGTLAAASRLVPWLRVSVAGSGSCAPPRGSENLGVVPTGDVMRVIADHDCFVLPSHRDGTPRALLEAMMVGRPIVATAVGRIPEIARHEREALLVPPGVPRALADALTRLRDDRPLRERLAEGAHARARAFSWARVGAAYRMVLDEVVAR